MQKIRTLALLMVGVFLLHSAGVLIILKALQFGVRIEMASKSMSENAVQQFDFSAKTFEKIAVRNGKEMDWQQQRYDIIKITRKNNRVIILAFIDQKETHLVNSMKQWLQKDKNKQHEHQIVYSLAILLCCYPPSESPITPQPSSEFLSSIFQYHFNYSGTFLSEINPPPQRV